MAFQRQSAHKQTQISQFFQPRVGDACADTRTGVVSQTEDPSPSEIPIEGHPPSSAAVSADSSATETTATSIRPRPQPPVPPPTSSVNRGPSDAIDVATRPVPPQWAISRITSSTLPGFKRILGILLPVLYPPKFFDLILPSSDLARVAIWRDPGPELHDDAEPVTVIGGIKCRIEALPPLPLDPTPSPQAGAMASPANPRREAQLYIQTIAVLSPYQNKGIATRLLDDVVREALADHADEGVSSVYAHVWQANGAALEWYEKRGFGREELVEDYYWRLRPASAWVLRRNVGGPRLESESTWDD